VYVPGVDEPAEGADGEHTPGDADGEPEH